MNKRLERLAAECRGKKQAYEEAIPLLEHELEMSLRWLDTSRELLEEKLPLILAQRDAEPPKTVKWYEWDSTYRTVQAILKQWPAKPKLM